MSLVDFAKRELKIISDKCEEGEDSKMQSAINEDIMQIIKTFSEQGHSGFSASYVISIINKLLKFQPLSELTGNDDEWVKLDYTEDVCYQNIRCPSIFKDNSGKAYNMDGKVFSNDNGHTWYTNKDSRVYITFPYSVPNNPEYVIIDNKVEREEYKSILMSIIKELNPSVKLDVADETELKTLLDEDMYNELSVKLKSAINVKQLENNIAGDDKIYQIVTNMLYSIENYINK